MSGSLKAPRGTFDVVPAAGEVLLAVRDALSAPLRLAGYAYVETPTFEDTSLFVRGVGESTDIVGKEMYSFTSRGGDELTLRPEGTAPVVRAALEHGLHRGGLPVKLWYSGSYYRYERPQAGRYRHFSQVGAEALGTDDPAVDAELIALAVEAYAALGLRKVRLLLNSLGDASDRPAYREALVAFLSKLELDAATRRRVAINPLRVLDDKRPEVQEQLAGAPLMVDFLSADSRAHYDDVRAFLTDAGVLWQEAPKLVRGLDYYTRTAFEFVHDGLGAQSAIGGGGRYDGLSESIGGPPLPSVGWALGVDRTLLALEAEGVTLEVPARVTVFAVPLGDEARREAFRLVTALRREGVAADLAYGSRSARGAMKAADRSGAAYALVLGERDLAAEVAQVKDMTSGDQTGVPLADVVLYLKEKLS
ncbi:MAG: histidine--tRNA ligase [Candidatus Nanopelagicales bacterium]